MTQTPPPRPPRRHVGRSVGVAGTLVTATSAALVVTLGGPLPRASEVDGGPGVPGRPDMVLAVFDSAAQPSSPSAAAPPWDAVRSILEARCLACHGGDSVRGGLRFATAETFAAGGDRGPLIDPAAPSDPARSHLAEVLLYENPEFAMPPSGRLPADEIRTLLAWADAGAPWPDGPAGRLADPDAHAEADPALALADAADWWAYRPLSDAPPPAASDPSWNQSAIDAFIRHGLDEAGLEPAPPAAPLALLRRATFDLTGLAPTLAEQDTFAAAWERDPCAAWSALVDRLLDDPAHGEHWARHWLDLVRYAETNGYERDSVKPNIWRYRDWVVRAFNEDLPYDEFVLHQLAGDELAERAPEALADPRDPGPQLATGYFRLGVWDDEPADREQARADEIADIVDTTGQVFLGTTMGCARCHDHKADPITQADYYAMTAWFNNIRPYGGDELTTPVADRPAPGMLTSLERDARVSAIEAELRPFFAELEAIEAAAGIAPPEPVVLVADARETPAAWRHLDGRAPDGWAIPSFDDSAWPEGRGGFAQGRAPGAIVGTEWTRPRIQLRTRFRLTEIPASLALSIHHDERAEIFLNGVRVLVLDGYRSDYTELALPPEALDALVVGSNVLGVLCINTNGPGYIDVGLRTGRAGNDPDAWLTRLAADGPDRLPAPQAGELTTQLDARRRLLDAPVAEAYPAMVVRELGPVAPEQPILLRGSAHAPGDVVAPAVPVVLQWNGGATAPAPTPTPTPASDGGATAPAPTPASDGGATTSGRRLAFARWLVDEGSFIVARTMANRLWQFHFGRGLCRSPGDFGRLGQEPTHPELLDHLARRLIELDWSLKAMHRELMLTRTYRMSSIPSSAALASDPLNDWYARFDARRLTAEQYRDAVLAAAGRLTERLGGPSVYPPLPAEALASSSRPDAAWGRSTPEDADRRSLYVHVKRSLPVPLLAALDQPSPDTVCPERFPTNVPTQALITLNGDFVQQAAVDMADRLLREAPGGVVDRIDLGLRLAFGRPADAATGEVARHAGFIARLRADHGLDERDATAAWCLFLFNANEFLWID